MGSLHADLLELIRDAKTLLQLEEGAFLASKEDADYFRRRRSPVSIPTQLSENKRALPKQIRPPSPSPQLAFVASSPPPKPQEPQEEKKESASPIVVSPPLPIKGLKAVFAKIAPQLAIFDEIPNDDLAKKIAQRWKTKNQSAPITLLSFQEIPEQKALLAQIARALDVYFGPARLIDAEPIEKENQWDVLLSVSELKLVICCDYALWQLKALMQHYKETPTQKMRQLKDKPLFLLPDLTLYLKDPMLKRSLWKGLCQTIHSLP